MKDYQILLYYKYVNIKDPEALMQSQRDLCESLNLKGRIIIASEGINGTLEGLVEDTEKYIQAMIEDGRFQDTHFKRSNGNGNAFPKLSVKVRSEIVSLHLGKEDINPNEVTGKYIEPEQLHELINSGEKFYIVDMRNDYEFKVGRFENSILPHLNNFRDLPRVVEELEFLKNEKVVTVCTGGVRCEKASGYLVKQGFNDVSQLYGGIVSYMEKYPNKDFKGKLYVFDSRVVMGFNTDSPDHEIISQCDKCGKINDNYVDCAYLHCKGHRHFICCKDCSAEHGKPYCSNDCWEKAQVEISVKLG